MNHKPRAWDRKNKYMFYFDDLHTDGEYGYLIFEPINEIRDKCNGEVDKVFFGNIKNYDITWSIDKHDKNGKEIYSGDIIEWRTKGYTMSGSYVANVGCSADDEIERVIIGDNADLSFIKYTIFGHIPRESTIEIIGNKFENEELYNETIKTKQRS